MASIYRPSPFLPFLPSPFLPFLPFLPSPFLPFLLFSFFISSSAVEDIYRERLGTLGTHYNLKKGIPYIQCEAYNGTHRISEECTPGPQFFFGRKFGCNSVVKVKDHKKYQGVKTDGMTLRAEDYEAAHSNCWHGGDIVHEQCLVENEVVDECIAIIQKTEDWHGLAFCCCNTHRCNEKVTVRFAKSNNTDEEEEPPWPWLKNSTDSTTSPDSMPLPDQYIWFWLLSISFILIVLSFLFFLLIRCVPCLRSIFFRGSDQKKPEQVPLVAMENGVRRNNLKEGLTLGEVIAEGKLGLVQKGIYRDPDSGKERIVAVKTIKDQKSFILEEKVYRLVNNSHDHLVHFIGSNFQPEDLLYYVVIEHHDNGCLESYLKEATFTPLEALQFLCSLMDGLDFLHTPSELPNGKWKAAIVHRDMKSRNVMVKADRTAAIADFGLGMICEDNRPYGRHYQVGTHRYMSPELLAGMASLNLDGLKQADVYAASLIIWEILNRTIVDENDVALPAELPYTKEIEEAVVAHQEKFEETRTNPDEEFVKMPIPCYLKDIVYRRDKRPQLRERLKCNPITAELVKTTLDMWDFEVDGRISAACAHSRLRLLEKNAINGTIPQPLC